MPARPHTVPVRIVIALAAIVLGACAPSAPHALGTSRHDPYRALATTASCRPNALPAGQAYPSGEPEPLWPVWCYRRSVVASTRQNGGNSWIDTFDRPTDMGRLDDGDGDYRVFDAKVGRGALRAAAFSNQSHWMVDLAGTANGGVLVRPDRAFHFEQGRLVIEADVAAAIPAYGDSAAAEVDVTTAPSPTGRVVDTGYGYGQFGGAWTFGCRFQADRQVTCSLFDASGTPGDPAVFGNERGRVWQVLPFQHVGAVHTNADPTDSQQARFRRCGSNQMDLFCRDRFRVELSADSIRVLVNGEPYLEESAIPQKFQLPAEFTTSGLYAYFTSWVDRPVRSVYRFHWDRLAVNPIDDAGSPLPPTAAPSYGTDHM